MNGVSAVDCARWRCVGAVEVEKLVKDEEKLECLGGD